MLFFANLRKEFNLFKRLKDKKEVQLAIKKINILK